MIRIVRTREQSLEQPKSRDQTENARGQSADSAIVSARPFTTIAASPTAFILIAFLCTVVVCFLYRPLNQPESGDASIYDYIAQAILRGQLPYRDVIDPKGPGGMYLSAFGLLIGRFLGIADVAAIRLLHILMFGLLSAATYLVARLYLKSNRAALLAFLLPLLPWRFVIMMISGTQPKLPMMLFGLLVLLAIERDRPFWAGALSMLSCLCWQPGLLFGGVAFLIFSRYLTSWKDLRAFKVVAGAAIPLGLVLLYFHHKGALSDFANWTFVYDYTAFMPSGEKPLATSLVHFWSVSLRFFEKEIGAALIAVPGFIWYLARRVRTVIAARSLAKRADIYMDAVVIPPLVYFAFCMLNFQSGPDLIPFLPFVGIFGAFFIIEFLNVAGSRLKMRNPATVRLAESRVFGVIVCLIFLATLVHGLRYQLPHPTLADQRRDVALVEGYLRPGDKVYIHETAEVLVLLNLPNLNPYVAFDSGADDYIGRTI
ncbi:MAG: hypothetical protein ACREDR_17590, partial [Blastocatellia bacterium]